LKYFLSVVPPILFELLFEFFGDNFLKRLSVSR